MPKFTVRSDNDDEHFVCVRGEPTGPAFPTRAAAERLVTTLNTPRRLLLVVQRSTFTKGCWDTYIKVFTDEQAHPDVYREGPARSAEDLLKAWWESQDAASYTRSRATVTVYDITGRRWDIFAADDPRRIGDPATQAPADTTLQLSFAPADIRSRARAGGRENTGADLIDESLITAARVLLARDRVLWEMLGQFDDEILRLAARVQEAGSGAQAP
jgi:hypothetical protein